jgi:uncharacterized Zn finger protein
MLPINLASIQANATPQTFWRGEIYSQSRSVSSLTQRGHRLQARVEDSEEELYQVGVEFDSMGITTVHCDCCYDLEGWCHHIVATLLAALAAPDAIAVRPPLAELLDGLSLSQIRQVLLTLAEPYPLWVDDFERQASLLKAVRPDAQAAVFSPGTTRRSSVDRSVNHSVVEAFRHQAKQVLRGAVEAWESGYDDDPVTADLLELVVQADEFIDNGDGDSAIAVLSGITQGCVEDWERVDEYSADSEGIVAALNQVWAEAILTAEWSKVEVKQLRSDLESWQDAWEDFPMALEALDQGWHYPPLVRVLQGEISELGAWAGESPDFADDLALVRLRILARQERWQEYLYLAEAEGQNNQYVAMLAQLGQLETAAEPESDRPLEMVLAEVENHLVTGWFDEAIAAVTDREGEFVPLVQQVMMAVMATDGDWVIENATDRASAIIDGGKSAAYGQAIEWLGLAKAAYEQADRHSDWAIYYSQLMATHVRKHKLVALLKELGAR